MARKYFIGVDIGGTKIYGGMVSPSGEIIRTLKVPTPAEAKAVDILKALRGVVRGLIREEGVSSRDLIGLGMAVPGVVDAAGKVVVTPNIRLSGVDLRKVLEKEYGVSVSVGNDVNMGVLGERWLGAARKARHVVGIFPGTGVGGGVIVDGVFISGAQGAAGELGHMVIDPAGPECGCGNKGCLEAFAGRWAIERDIRAALRRGEKSVITEVAGRRPKRVRSGALRKALDAHDPLVTRVVHGAAAALGRACVSLNHVFNPEMFLFGGGLVEACGDHLLPAVEQALKKDPFFAKLNTPVVAASKLGDDAVMLGAVAAARHGCSPMDLKDGPYYPALRVLAGGRVSVGSGVFDRPFFIRADGKVKEPGDMLPSRLTEADMVEICRKGPEVLLIASSRGKRLGLSSKAIKLLQRNKIELRRLPLAQAARVYAASDARRAILFNI